MLRDNIHNIYAILRTATSTAQNVENKVYIQEESEEQEYLILIAADWKITLMPLICFGTTMVKLCKELHGLQLINSTSEKIDLREDTCY